MWEYHRGVIFWSQSPPFLGNNQINLLLLGETGTQKITNMNQGSTRPSTFCRNKGIAPSLGNVNFSSIKNR